MNRCRNCGEETKNNKFCSRSCAATVNNAVSPKIKREPATTKCKTCGELTYNRVWCSLTCKPKRERIEHPCEQCGASTRHTRFCSQACNYEAMRTEGQWWKVDRPKSAPPPMISVEERDALLASQDGLCALCRKRQAKCLDHCHQNGHIRGMLCRGCNAALGALGDTPEALYRAYLYVLGSQGDRAACKPAS